MESLNYVLGIGLGTDNNGHRIDAAIVDYENAVFLEKMGVSQRLKSLECDDNVCLTLLDHGLVNLFAEADEGNYAAASLCHAVNLTDLYVKTCLKSGLSDYSACKERALTANSYYHYILSHFYVLTLLRC